MVGLTLTAILANVLSGFYCAWIASRPDSPEVFSKIMWGFVGANAACAVAGFINAVGYLVGQ